MHLPSKIEAFFLKNKSIVDAYENGRSFDEVISFSEELVNELIEVPLYSLVQCIRENDIGKIHPSNIPQYSSFEDGTFNIIKRLRMAGDIGPTFKELGEQFLGDNRKTGAYVKYGENHSKLARQYELVYFMRNGSNKVFLTDIGKRIEKLNIDIQDDVLIKISLKIPIIQYCLKHNAIESQEIEKVLNKYLSPTTALRRKSNVVKIVKKII